MDVHVGLDPLDTDGRGQAHVRLHPQQPASARRTMGAPKRVLTTLWPYGSFSMQRICRCVSRWVPDIVTTVRERMECNP